MGFCVGAAGALASGMASGVAVAVRVRRARVVRRVGRYIFYVSRIFVFVGVWVMEYRVL